MSAPNSATGRRSSLNPIRENPYWVVGLMLIVANVIPGIILYAFVASIVGEDVLEGDGGPTWLGAGLVYLPPVVGVALVLFGRPLSRGPLSPSRPWVPLVLLALGAVGTILGLLGVGDTSGGANIGAALLLLVCPFLTVLVGIWVVAVFRK
jgi:hypothetical protein